MGCQTKIAKKIVDKSGDCFLAVKGNQGRLFTKLNEIFNVHRLNSASENIFSQSNKRHGREETRHHMVIHDLTELGDTFNLNGLSLKALVIQSLLEKKAIKKKHAHFAFIFHLQN